MARKAGLMERFSSGMTRTMGSSRAFVLAVVIVAVWAATGPIFDHSNTWQLVINTGTTIVTFLMVFLLQRSQNKDAMAIQMKLNELVAAIEGASNRLINAEDLCEDDVRVLKRHYCELAKLARQEEDVTVSHSVEDARRDHARKAAARRRIVITPAADGATDAARSTG